MYWQHFLVTLMKLSLPKNFMWFKQPKWFDSVYLLDCIKGLLWLQPCTVTSSAEHASAALG